MSENAGGGVDLFPLFISVSTASTSERNHKIVFRYEQNTSTALVEALTQPNNPQYDVLFGTRVNSDDPLEVAYLLKAGVSVIPPLMTMVRNDLHVEDHECYTISILSDEISCSEDDSDMNGFFCDHTVCILDDDGQFCYGCFTI